MSRNIFIKECAHYIRLTRSYWCNRKSLWSWVLIAGVLGFSWLFVYLSVYMNELSGHLYDFVEQKDKSGVMSVFKNYACVMLIYLFAYSIKHFLLSSADFQWRKFLSNHIIRLWLDKKKYHHVRKSIDNPDQRISEDINSFCTKLLNMLLIFFAEGMTFIAFIGVLWNFPFSFEFSLMGHQFSIPHYLALGCGVYAIAMNVILILIGKPIIPLDYEQEQKEANYRYALMRINSHSEEIAFHRGEEIEQDICSAKFFQIKQNYYALIKKTFTVNLFTFGFSITLSTLPILAGMPLFFSDKISFGELMRIGGAATSVLCALGVLVQSFQLFASLQAAKNRLTRFLDALETIGDQHEKDLQDKVFDSDGKIALSNITLTNREGKILLNDLNFEIELGKKLLIMGRSGIGKTSILRCLAQIWMPDSGQLHLPKHEISFVPQRPYLPLGTLQSCLNYPHKSPKSDDDLVAAETLSLVGLEHLIEYLDVEKDYLKMLSLGELQRLNIARVLLHQPRILIMDEPTSSLDEYYEELMLGLLNSKLQDGVTIITVSHSKALAKYHDHVIEIKQDKDEKLVLDRTVQLV